MAGATQGGVPSEGFGPYEQSSEDTPAGGAEPVLDISQQAQNNRVKFRNDNKMTYTEESLWVGSDGGGIGLESIATHGL